MSERTVTIFVTVYNIEKHLERFFECLKAQTYTDYEVLMIDDGSTDNSLAVCRQYADADDRIRVISVDHMGISAARNLAFENLRTPFATSLDGDDYFDKDYLKHLMDAEEETGADMVLSNVIYVYEDGREKERFVFRPAGRYSREDFEALLPELLDENRLNFLYAKLYKTALLKDVRVEPDVMQGSDTMINFMVLNKAQSIAVTEDYDYSYVQYKKRSVTSYMGADYFSRLYRINRFLLDKTAEYGFLNDEMLRVIDGRILHIGRTALSRIAQSSDSLSNRYKRASEVVNSEEYLLSYHRQEERGNLPLFRERYRYEPIAPGREKQYIDHVLKVRRDAEKSSRIRRLREKCPDGIFRIWHGMKMKLGIARKE